jgi:hypothetical protein
VLVVTAAAGMRVREEQGLRMCHGRGEELVFL